MGTWTRVQGTGTTNSASSGNTTINLTGVAVGDLLVVATANYNAFITGGVGDTVNTWHQFGKTNNGLTHTELWYTVVTTGGSLAITATGTAFIGMAVTEFNSGGGAIATDGAAATATGVSGTAASGNITIQTPALVVGAFGAGSAEAWQNSGAYTIDYSAAFATGVNYGVALAYDLSVGSSPADPAAGFTTTPSWAAVGGGFYSTAVNPPSAYDTLILSETSLVDYWQLNETSGSIAVDSKGTKPLTLGGTNPPTVGQTGLASGGTSYLFNGQGGGAGSYALITPGFNIAGTGASIEAWVYIATNPGEGEWICGMYYSGFLVGDLQIDSGRDAVFHCWDNGSSGKTITGSQIPLNTWTHLVGVAANAGTMQLYINDVAQTPQTFTGSVFWTTNGTSTNGWNIGGGTTSGKDAKFQIAKVAVYNAALTSTQVSNHYAAGPLLPVSAFPSALLAGV